MTSEDDSERPSPIPTSVPSPDDSQAVEKKTLAVATAVGELVEPIKSVLKLTKDVVSLARLAIVLMLVMLLATGVAVWRQQKLLDYLEDSATAQRENTKTIEGLVTLLDIAAQDVADVKEDVESIPRIEVKPADATDPTSQPVAVLRPGKITKRRKPPTSTSGTTKADPPPTPVGIEIPLGIPKKTKRK